MSGRHSSLDTRGHWKSRRLSARGASCKHRLPPSPVAANAPTARNGFRSKARERALRGCGPKRLRVGRAALAPPLQPQQDETSECRQSRCLPCRPSAGILPVYCVNSACAYAGIGGHCAGRNMLQPCVSLEPTAAGAIPLRRMRIRGARRSSRRDHCLGAGAPRSAVGCAAL